MRVHTTTAPALTLIPEPLTPLPHPKSHCVRPGLTRFCVIPQITHNEWDNEWDNEDLLIPVTQSHTQLKKVH